VLSLTLAGCGSGGGGSDDDPVELSFLLDNTEATISTAEALVDAFEAENADITITTETRPGGAEGDNIVKTRLATGEMTDLFWYNSGSLFQALNPDQTLLNLSDQEWVGGLAETFQAGVSTDNGLYGAPAVTAARSQSRPRTCCSERPSRSARARSRCSDGTTTVTLLGAGGSTCTGAAGAGGLAPQANAVIPAAVRPAPRNIHFRARR
jgi:hypothetical protein